MNGIIIYQSKYGATEQYASWLADALKLHRVKVEAATPATIEGREVVILGSPIYAGQLLIKKWLQQNINLLSNKQIFLFIVSGSTTNDQALQQQVINNNLDPALRAMVKVFFLPGKCNVSRLSWMDRLVLKMGAWLEKDPQKKMIMKSGFDNMDRRALDALVEAVSPI